MMINTSGLEPKGHAVLLRMVELEEMKTTLIEIPEHVRRNSAVMEQRAEIVAIGGEAWREEKSPRAVVGDKVVVTKLAGWITRGADGKLYRLVNDRDIFCQVTKESNDG